MAAVASLPALDWHAAQDGAAMLAQNRRQTARIIAAAQGLGLDLITPLAQTARGGSVMLRLAGGQPAAGVVQALREEGISTDGRGSILRMSPGVVTTDTGVDRLIAGLAAHARG